jgi:hypothetical protein
MAQLCESPLTARPPFFSSRDDISALTLSSPLASTSSNLLRSRLGLSSLGGGGSTEALARLPTSRSASSPPPPPWWPFRFREDDCVGSRSTESRRSTDSRGRLKDRSRFAEGGGDSDGDGDGDRQLPRRPSSSSSR